MPGGRASACPGPISPLTGNLRARAFHGLGFSATASLFAMAAPPPPIAVISPTLAAPRLIFIPANCPMVANTPASWWDPAPAGPGGAPRVAMPTYRAIRIFGPVLRISRVPADLAAARTQSSLGIGFTDAAWSRFLTAIELALMARFALSPLAADEHPDAVMAALVFNPATDVEVTAGDWSPGQPHVPPRGTGADAIAACASLAQIRFLSLVNPATVEVTGPLPGLHFAMLVGAMGECGLQAARLPENCAVQLLADFLTGHFAKGASDTRQAHSISALLKSHTLPLSMRRPLFDPGALLGELEDGAELRQGAAGVAAVEERRILLLTRG